MTSSQLQVAALLLSIQTPKVIVLVFINSVASVYVELVLEDGLSLSVDGIMRCWKSSSYLPTFVESLCSSNSQ